MQRSLPWFGHAIPSQQPGIWESHDASPISLSSTPYGIQFRSKLGFILHSPSASCSYPQFHLRLSTSLFCVVLKRHERPSSTFGLYQWTVKCCGQPTPKQAFLFRNNLLTLTRCSCGRSNRWLPFGIWVTELCTYGTWYKLATRSTTRRRYPAITRHHPIPDLTLRDGIIWKLYGHRQVCTSSLSQFVS